MVTRLASLGVVAVLVTACTSFEDENIVIDIRPLAMQATPPEQILDVDLANPPSPASLLAMLQPTVVCALVADPTNDRRLRWTMTLCPGEGGDRCDDDDPQVVLGSGLADDPELSAVDFTDPANCVSDSFAVAPQCMCTVVQPDGGLLAVLQRAIDNDDLAGFQGLDYAVQLRVGGENADPSLDQYASKALRVAARLPPDRTANANPSLMHFQTAIPGADNSIVLPGRCVDNVPNAGIPAPNEPPVRPGTKINILPIENSDTREMYVIPTLDGGSEMFTESPTYQWVATGGGISRGSTGGPKDPFGNDTPIDSDWTAPDDVTEPTDFTIWIVQRDERLGSHWYSLCAHVTPP